jgi:hypothetical protein
MKSVAHTMLPDMGNMLPDPGNIKLPSKFVCEKCNSIFANRHSLSRHKHYRCKTFFQENKLTETISILNNKVNELIETKRDDHNLINLLLEYVKESKISYHNKNSNNTYNISVKNYLQQNYPNAPHLESIIEPEKIKYDQHDDEFIDALVYNYNNKILDKYIGDFLIKCYKKDDPSKQSMWSSDISRLTYVIKELLSNNQSIWNHDYKGIKIKEYIIRPLLRYIKEYVDEYWMSNLDQFKNTDIKKINKFSKIYNSLHMIKKDIDNDILTDEIVKYIAPNFYIKKRQ